MFDTKRPVRVGVEAELGHQPLANHTRFPGHRGGSHLDLVIDGGVCFEHPAVDEKAWDRGRETAREPELPIGSGAECRGVEITDVLAEVSEHPVRQLDTVTLWGHRGEPPDRGVTIPEPTLYVERRIVDAEERVDPEPVTGPRRRRRNHKPLTQDLTGRVEALTEAEIS